MRPNDRFGLRMNWFRAKTRQVTSFALFALAINLALSFGHIHLEGFRGSETNVGVLLSAISHGKGDQPVKHDGHPDDLCPICMARAALGTGLATSPPVLLLGFAYVTVEPTFVAGVAIPQRPRANFQSRGPPLS
jgi:hypothetical protein